jgi:hypothetical protein
VTHGIDLLLWDLKHRVLRPAAPFQQVGELGRFVEAVVLAVKTLFERSSGQIEQWHVEFQSRGRQVHAQKYAQFVLIYAHRNMGLHENVEAFQISPDDPRTYLRFVQELLPRLAEDFMAIGLDLERELLRQRKTALHLNRAQVLEDAILRALGGNADRVEAEVWPVVAGALPDGFARGVARNPNVADRLHRSLLHLAKGAGHDDACPLRRLALHLSDVVSLEDWLAKDHATLATVAQKPRELPTFRVEVEGAPSGEGWLVTGATIVHPRELRVDEALGPFPVEAASQTALFRCVMRLFDAASDAARNQGWTIRPEQFLLHLAVSAESAMFDWERIKPPGPKPSLAVEFLAVAIDPIDEDFVRVDLDEPLHPDAVALLWEPLPPTDLVARCFGRATLIAGPPVWRAEIEGRCPVLWVMSQRAAAVLLPHTDPDSACQEVGLDDAGVTWAELVARLGALMRQAGGGQPGAYRIFLTDRRYQPLAAHSLY